jgi:hypothetical protein
MAPGWAARQPANPSPAGKKRLGFMPLWLFDAQNRPHGCNRFASRESPQQEKQRKGDITMEGHSYNPMPANSERPVMVNNILVPDACSKARGKRLLARTTRALPRVAFALLLAAIAAYAQDRDPFLPLPNAERSVSTVPPNGDLNPYGVAYVPASFPQSGILRPGDILVSNFNNNMNLQGTGTTVIRIPQNGSSSLFFQGKPGIGLTTALSVLKAGLVLVGNLPTSDGTCATAQPGSILVLNSSGAQIGALSGNLIDGPWDSALFDLGNSAILFVSNVLRGTVVRFELAVSPTGVSVMKATQIASGYMHRCDPVALVVGPTGLAFDAPKNVLYVASTEDNAVFAVHGAATTTKDRGPGDIIYSDPAHLHGPLALEKAPNGDLLVSNSDVINVDPNQPSEIVEFTKTGAFVRELSIDPNLGGSFGLATAFTTPSRKAAQFAAVDDNASTLTIWNIPIE